ncbi:MAG: Rrf2 family transcriptional regulator [Spirochaetaceae bacterium]|jgi:Rrf2 family protein|nr:Rrf2 family transcriptional regulator [Spirochaetaceae bacterium]
MRISVRTRYGLAALVCMARKGVAEDRVTITSLSEKLQISKIYLEQVFSLLRRSGIVISAKGAQGGYNLSRPAKKVTVYDILSATETALFEKTDKTVADENIEKTLRDTVFDPLDASLKETLSRITLEDIVNQAALYMNGDYYMYYGI